MEERMRRGDEIGVRYGGGIRRKLLEGEEYDWSSPSVLQGVFGFWHGVDELATELSQARDMQFSLNLSLSFTSSS